MVKHKMRNVLDELPREQLHGCISDAFSELRRMSWRQTRDLAETGDLSGCARESSVGASRSPQN